MEVVVTTGAINRAKLQSNHHHQQTNIQFFYRLDAIPVALVTLGEGCHASHQPSDASTPITR